MEIVHKAKLIKNGGKSKTKSGWGERRTNKSETTGRLRDNERRVRREIMGQERGAGKWDGKKLKEAVKKVIFESFSPF